VSRIIVSLHVEFDEADFPFSASPRPTNDLDIFETGKSTQWRLMVPLGFPPLLVHALALRMPPGFAPLPVVHLPTASCVVSTSLVTPHVAPLQVYTPLSSVSLPDTYFTASVPLH
jgi:hypothetical protein